MLLADGLLDRLDDGGDLVLLVRPAGPAVHAALDDAVRLVQALAHPDEPGDAWANGAYVEEADGLPALRVDLKDRQAHQGVSAVVVGLLVAALADVPHDVTVDLPAAAPVVREAVQLDDPAPDDEPDRRGWLDPTSADVHRLVAGFPWPRGAVPAMTAGGTRQATALVARAAPEVVEELAVGLAGAGRLLLRGRVEQHARVLLLAEQHGVHWLVMVGPDGVGARVEATVPRGGRLTDAELREVETAVVRDPPPE